MRLTADWAAAQATCGIRWAFAARAVEGAVSFHIGVPREAWHRLDPLSTAVGCFPGAEVEEAAPLLGCERFSSAGVLRGSPSAKWKGRTAMDVLGRAMVHRDWLFLAVFQPVAVETVARMVQTQALNLRTIHAQYLLRGSAADEKDRLAQRCVDHAKAAIAEVGLEGRLPAIAEWSLERKA